LSPGLFLFAIAGNTLYALSIVAKSVDKKYLIANASWFVGEPRFRFGRSFLSSCQSTFFARSDAGGRRWSCEVVRDEVVRCHGVVGKYTR
jgi:hypothetical protein